MCSLSQSLPSVYEMSSSYDKLQSSSASVYTPDSHEEYPDETVRLLPTSRAAVPPPPYDEAVHLTQPSAPPVEQMSLSSYSYQAEQHSPHYPTAAAAAMTRPAAAERQTPQLQQATSSSLVAADTTTSPSSSAATSQYPAVSYYSSQSYNNTAPPPAAAALSSPHVHLANNYQQPQQPQQPQHLSHTHPNIILVDRVTTYCEEYGHQMDWQFTTCGLLCGVLCFPIGLICCWTCRHRYCSKCGQTLQ